MARNRICAAAAMAEARSRGLPRYRTFRPQPGPGRWLEEHAEPLASGKVQASARQLPAAVEVNFLVTPLPREALASLLAWAFLLLSPPVWIFRLSRFCVRFPSCAISSSPISV